MSCGAPSTDVELLPLAELRRRIDVLDERIVAALAERMTLARATSARKDGPVRDPRREAAVLAHVEESALRLGVDAASIAAVYAVILELSRGLQTARPSTTP